MTLWNTFTTTETILTGIDLPTGAFEPEPILVLDTGAAILVVDPFWLNLARRTRLHIWREQ